MFDTYDWQGKVNLQIEKQLQGWSTKWVLVPHNNMNKLQQRCCCQAHTPWQPLHSRAGMQVLGVWLGCGNQFPDKPLVSLMATDGIPRLQKDPGVHTNQGMEDGG